jgi:heptaprenyl diphosphate synthase
MRKRSSTRRMTLLTMLLAMSILLHMIEPALPIPVPGVKLGLANILGLITLYLFGIKEMMTINIMRVLMASLLRGIIFGTGFWLSMSGMLLSSLITILLFKQNKFTKIGISMASSAFHGVGQILALIFINNTVMMIYWLPMLWFSSVPTGYITGTLSIQVLKRLKVTERNRV